MSTEELTRLIDLLARQVGHWTKARWAASTEPGGSTRAEVVHALVQRLADLAAAAEGEPRREVPRLENEVALADQLRVVTADLVEAGASDRLIQAAVADVAAVRARL